MVGTPVNIPQVGLPISIDQLREEVDAFQSAIEAHVADGEGTTGEEPSGRSEGPR
jgi:hypothetical protein